MKTKNQIFKTLRKTSGVALMLLTASVYFSCTQEQTISSSDSSVLPSPILQLDPNGIVSPEGKPVTILGGSAGLIGSELKKMSYKANTVNYNGNNIKTLSNALPTNGGTLIINAELRNTLKDEEIEKIYEEALNKNNTVIFESSKNDHQAIGNIAKDLVGLKIENPADIDGVLIQRVNDGLPGHTITSIIGKNRLKGYRNTESFIKNSYSRSSFNQNDEKLKLAQISFDSLNNKIAFDNNKIMANNKSYLNNFSLKSNNTIKSAQKISSSSSEPPLWSEPLDGYTWVFTNRSISEVETLLRNHHKAPKDGIVAHFFDTGNHIRWDGNPSYSVPSLSKMADDVHNKSAIIVAKGECRYDVQGAAQVSVVYNRGWNVSMAAGPKLPGTGDILKEVSGGAGVGWSSSKSTGFSSGSAIKLKKEFAQCLLVSPKSNVHARFVGSVRFSVRFEYTGRCERGIKRWCKRSRVNNITINYNKDNNKQFARFSGPKSPYEYPFFIWNQYNGNDKSDDYLLPICK